MLKFFAILLAGSLAACGQQPRRAVPVVLARVDSTQITDADFEAALAKLDAGHSPARALEDWRRQFQLLIDRQLLLREARQQGLADAPQVLYALQTWERGKQIELLMKQQMGAQLAWDEQQLEEYFAARGAQREIRLSRLVLRDRAQAMAALERAQRGEAFARIVAEYYKPGQPYSGDLGWLNPLASPDPRLASLFAREKGAVELIESAGTYFLLAVTDKRQVSLAERRQMAEQALSQKQQNEANLAYLEYLVGKYAVRLDTTALQRLLAPAPPAAMRLVRSALGDWTIGEYLNAVKVLPQPELPASVPALSFQVTRAYLVDQVLAREAQEKGIQEQLRESRERLREQKMVEALWERQGLRQVPVAEAELNTYYEAHKNDYPPPPPSPGGMAEWQARITRDLQEQKAAPLFEAYLASLRQRYAAQVQVDEERFQAFVSRRRQAQAPAN